MRAWELIVVDQAVVVSETRGDMDDDAAGCGEQISTKTVFWRMVEDMLSPA